MENHECKSANMHGLTSGSNICYPVFMGSHNCNMGAVTVSSWNTCTYESHDLVLILKKITQNTLDRVSAYGEGWE